MQEVILVTFTSYACHFEVCLIERTYISAGFHRLENMLIDSLNKVLDESAHAEHGL